LQNIVVFTENITEIPLSHLGMRIKQMFGKLLAFVFSFFAAIAFIPLIVTAAVLLFKLDLKSFMVLHPLDTAMTMAGYVFYGIFAFFALQDFFSSGNPIPKSLPSAKRN
jgi:hypothetical protein